ncbi:MAG: branched-chain amino acid ABC transporter permease, partial [Anaerolineae bacterium]|nr:branched-chain amino acid ABC transporter permease [Anaerolineae bacterium]
MMQKLDLKNTIRLALIAGLVSLSVSAIGMVETFSKRDLISGFLTMGHVLLYSAPLFASYLATNIKPRGKSGSMLFSGMIAGLFSALPLAGLILIDGVVENIRDFLVNVSPDLIKFITFSQSGISGYIYLAVSFMIAGLVGTSIHFLPISLRHPLSLSFGWTLGIGVFSEVLLTILRQHFSTSLISVFFASKGITVLAAGIIFVASFGAGVISHNKQKKPKPNPNPEKSKSRGRPLNSLIIFSILLLLPWILGTYLTEVVDNVGLYILMGLGLNIVVGFAGLLDLGYVAFFAIGAYVMGALTSSGHLGMSTVNFWVALPISVIVAVLFGVILGVPVLKMRGDYLAIVTLGFGEIIRILASSDLLKSYIGGAQGILQIPRPEIGSMVLGKPIHLYYLILICCLAAAYISYSLRDSRLGRQWMAMREDEDVAEAMGINLVTTKLLAFATGAAFS